MIDIREWNNGRRFDIRQIHTEIGFDVKKESDPEVWKLRFVNRARRIGRDDRKHVKSDIFPHR